MNSASKLPRRAERRSEAAVRLQRLVGHSLRHDLNALIPAMANAGPLTSSRVINVKAPIARSRVSERLGSSGKVRMSSTMSNIDQNTAATKAGAATVNGGRSAGYQNARNR